MRNALRAALRARVQPMIEQLAADLTELAAERIEADLAHVEEIIEYTLSAIASDLGAPPLDHDLLTDALGPELAGMLDSARPRKGTAREPAADQQHKRTGLPGEVGGGRPVKLQANGKRPPTCQACGFVGGNTRGCGTSHPTQDKVATAPDAPDPKQDRFARIEAQAEARRRGAVDA